MFDIILVDDEWYSLEEIRDLSIKSGVCRVVGQYTNPFEALEEVEKLHPQAAFIDIEMPGMDGLTLAEKLQEKIPGISVVFITGWNQYAVQAFEVNALDYIMKPISTERFKKMIEKTMQSVQQCFKKGSHLKISCFGNFDVSVNDTQIAWQRAKAEELFAYLLTYQGTYIHKSVILETLWPDYESSKALTILQSSVYKIRSLFSDFKDEVSLKYQSNRYGLFLSGVDCDYTNVQKAIKNYRIGDSSSYDSIIDAASLAEKGFLCSQGYVWSMEKSEEINRKLIHILKEILKNRTACKDDEQFLSVLTSLARLVPYDNDANIALLQYLKAQGRSVEMLKHFQWLQKTLREEYDEEPSDEISEFFMV